MDHARHQHQHQHQPHKHADGTDCHCDHEDATPSEGSAIDPICGMTVEMANARFTSQFEGQTYYFCSDSCRQTFNRDPAAALKR